MGSLGYTLMAAATESDIVAGVQTVVDSATSTFTPTTIGNILAVFVGSAAGLFLLWWGTRKGVKVVKNAFSKGKLSI